MIIILKTYLITLIVCCIFLLINSMVVIHGHKSSVLYYMLAEILQIIGLVNNCQGNLANICTWGVLQISFLFFLYLSKRNSKKKIYELFSESDLNVTALFGFRNMDNDSVNLSLHVMKTVFKKANEKIKKCFAIVERTENVIKIHYFFIKQSSFENYLKQNKLQKLYFDEIENERCGTYACKILTLNV